jgi:ATP/ADP translocase
MRLPGGLDVRPDEVRPVSLSFLGAFLVIAFLILARSLRESIYITVFPVESLPYVVASVALLSVPSVGLFARQLSRHEPRRVLVGTVVIIAAGLAVLWPFATRLPAAVVVFYLWTALGALLLTSGFWIVTAEYFPVRGAKRLYGLIGAGGTAGAMVMGNSISWLLGRLSIASLVPVLIALLLAFLAVQLLLPAMAGGLGIGDVVEDSRERRPSAIREGLTLVWQTPHLRTIALIVASATVASTLVDYQFKELARGILTTKEQLAGFFGAFYGWTGAIALVIQLLVSARFLARAGIAVTIAVLPTVLLLGSTALFLLPGLLVATLVRGADSSLRKSLHRSVLEVLYVPIPSALRRKTKTFIDSVVDAGAEGLGAAIVFLWVTLPGFPSHYLSLFVMVVAGFFIYQSRRMERSYRRTISDQLVEGGVPGPEGVARLDQSLLMSATFTEVDIRSALAEIRADAGAGSAPMATPEASEIGGRDGPAEWFAGTAGAAEALLERLSSRSPVEVASALDEIDVWTEAHIPALIRLLARDAFSRRVISILAEMGDLPTAYLAAELGNEAGDFVIRRRVPRVFAASGGDDADSSLLDALTAGRFEIRYRAASALVRRRRAGLPESDRNRRKIVWSAVRRELDRDQPVWELQRLLDEWESDDDLVSGRAQHRGQLSLKHTFRLVSLILDQDAVRAAYQGIVSDDDRLLSLALEYLEQVLPKDVKDRLWPFIGDLTERQREKAIRPLGEVVEDLVKTEATLFQSEEEREALRRLLEEEG